MSDNKDILFFLGEQVRQARLGAGLRQDGLAQLCEMTQAEVSRIERGVKDTRMETILGIALACGAQVKVGPETVTKASQVYGIIGSATLRKGWRNSALAEASGVSQPTLSEWGRNSIGRAMISNVIKVLKALGMEMEIN